MVTRVVKLLILVALVMAASTGAGTALLSPDIAIRENGEGLQVFVVDPTRGRLLFGAMPRGPRSVSPANLSPATPCGAFDGAVAVTVRDSRLVVVRGEPAPAVLECDLDTRQVNVVHTGEPLRVPTSVAIAADGSIAVLDRVLRGVVVLRRDARPTVLLRVSSAPMALRADDLGQLYVVDFEMRGIVPIDPTDSKGTPSNPSFSSASQKGRGGALLSLSVEAASFAVFRDVFYVAETTGALRAQLTGGRLSIEVPDVRPRPAAVAVSRDHLATIDREASLVEIIDRPLPAGLLLDPARGNPNEAWLQLLEYMAESRLLPRDRVTVTPDDTTYEALLTRTGVLLKSDVNPQKVAIAPGSAKGLFCILNRTVCSAGYSTALPFVVIPQASPQSVLQTETTVLDGRDVRSWVAERVLLGSHQREVTDAYLTTRNPSVAATLENELLRRKMVMATPMDKGLGAGTVIRIDKGREIVLGQVATMCDGLTPLTSKTSLQSRLMVPRGVLPDLGITPAPDRAYIDVGTWLRSTISTATLEKCGAIDGPQDAYVIIESLAIASTVFTPIVPDRPQTSNRVLEGPLYVGYKAVPLSGLRAGVAVPAETERLKPMAASAPSAIWTISSGSLTLPVTRWRTDVLLPAPDFYARDGFIRRLRAGQPALDLSPRERLDRTAFSSHVSAVDGEEGDVTAKVQEAHKTLITAIQYDAKLADATGAEDVYIGIVEHPDSVNLDHPGFVLDDQSAWFDFVQGAGALQPHRAQAGTASMTLRRVDREREHGTHVAGIIAARRPPIGMLPKTRLFLVPSDNMSDLKNWIQTARDNFVYVFNLSLGFPPASSPDADAPEDPIQDLHGRIADSWKDALFVVAAGNAGANLNVTGAPPPVLWSATLPNVMTVGASDAKGENVLGQHRDGQDEEERRGSNFGAQYVDLVAPGQIIHSLGKDGYAYACGSSHAAPQVTATAAMLWAHSTKPEVVRARLIYTADWREPNFDRKVWGGLLNVRRAIFAPKANVFTRFGTDQAHEIKFAPAATVRIDGDVQNRNGSPRQFREERFPFSRVLRIESLGGGRSRIFLLENPNSSLTIVKGTISGTIKCQSVKRYDQTTQKFSLDPDPPVSCQQGISIGQMKDYVGAIPAAVRFQ